MSSSPGFSFDAASHSYSIGGTRVVSVTQAIGAAGLIESDWFTEYSRERGRKVHLATEYDDFGDLDYEGLDPVLRPYVDAYRKFKAETRFVPELIESRFFQENAGYAGTFDRRGKIGGVRPCIMDLKSGAMCPWVRLQLAGYANSQPDGGALERYGVQLRKDGTYRMVTFPVREFRQDLNDFLVCVRAHQLQEEMKCHR